MAEAPSSVFGVVKQAVYDFIADDAMTLAGALAFYTALSFAPLLLITLSIIGLLGEDKQQAVVQQIESVVGPQAGQAVEMVVNPEQAGEAMLSDQERRQIAQRHGVSEDTVRAVARGVAGGGAGAGGGGDEQGGGDTVGRLRQAGGGFGAGVGVVLGFGILLFSASGVFAQLQYSLNRIWDVQPKPTEGGKSAVWQWVRKRLLSVGMIFAILFLLLVSLFVSAAISAVFTGEGAVWQVVNFLVSMLVFVLLFAVMFRYLPDVSIQWGDVWFGALATAILFSLGKWAIGLYLGHSSVGSGYGAAGSLIVLLVWVYYSSLILFFGAELTQTFARWRGSRIVPDKHAVWIDEEAARTHGGDAARA